MNHKEVEIDLSIVDLNPTLQALNKLGERNLKNFLLTYRIALIIKQVKSELKVINEIHDKLVKRLGKEDKKTGAFKVTPEDDGWQEYIDQNEELSKGSVHVKCKQIPLSLFIDKKEDGKHDILFDITSADLISLMPFIEPDVPFDSLEPNVKSQGQKKK